MLILPPQYQQRLFYLPVKLFCIFECFALRVALKEWPAGTHSIFDRSDILSAADLDNL